MTGGGPEGDVGPGWDGEIAALRELRAAALAMGGRERVARQRAQGKLTVRERVDRLFDAGTFDEIGILADHDSTRPDMQERRAPADGVVTGHGEIDGRPAFVLAADFTVFGGSDGATGRRKQQRIKELAGEMRAPLVYLLDGSGARAQEAILDGWPGGEGLLRTVGLSGMVPQVAAVMGPTAGGPALVLPLCDFSVFVRPTGMLASGGPPLVEAATGLRISKEELGGWEAQGEESGVVHNPAESDEDCITIIRRYLGYMPTSCWERPPRVAAGDDPFRADQDLLDVIPRDRRRPYDMARVIRGIVDRDSSFEIQPGFGRAMLVGLARVDGYVVGIVANQPQVMAGAINVEEADKEAHFLQLCNAYAIPILFLADVPGLMVGPLAEREGILRRGVRVAHVLGQLRVPTISVAIRKVYGMGAVAMNGPGNRQLATLAWPSAEFGGLPAEGGVQAGFSRSLDAAEDQLSARQALEARYRADASVFVAARRLNFDDVIDPRETRGRIVRLLRRAPAPEPGPWTHTGIMP